MLSKYEITLEQVEAMNKSTYKDLVKNKIKKVALASLTEQCKQKGKTAALTYSSMKPQEYLCQLFPNQAKFILQCRSKTLNIKDHRKFMYRDMICRRCLKADETLHHVVNCGYDVILDPGILFVEDDDFSYERKLLFTTIASRLKRFMDDLKDHEV